MTGGDSTRSGSTITVCATSGDGIVNEFAYDGDISIRTLVNDLTEAVGWNLEPVYLEIETESERRSTGFGEGTRFGVGVKEGRLDFERQPTEVVKTRGRIIWRKPDKDPFTST